MTESWSDHVTALAEYEQQIGKCFHTGKIAFLCLRGDFRDKKFLKLGRELVRQIRRFMSLIFRFRPLLLPNHVNAMG